MTHYVLTAETDAMGVMVRAVATPSPTGWTVTTTVGGTEVVAQGLGPVPVLEAAEALVSIFTGLLMSINLERTGNDSIPERE